MSSFDITIVQLFNVLVGTPFFDFFIIFFAKYLLWVVIGSVFIFPIGSLFGKFRQHRRKNTELFLVAFLSALFARFVVTELIRFLYHSPRPFEVLPNIRQFLDHVNSSSFPSGHATFSFALAAVISMYYPKTSILFFAAAILMGAARVASGVHWPSDILGGAVIGVGTGLLGYAIAKRFLPR